MSCAQTLSGLVHDCAANMGGISQVLLANKADIASITKTSGKITAITMQSTAKFHAYDLKAGTSSMSSNYQVSAENGTTYVQTDLLLVFNRMDTLKRLEVTAMAAGELVAIVKDANGLYWLLGEYEPLTLSAGDGLTGTARGDRNGYSVTLQDNAPEMPTEILTGTGGVDIDAITA